jgi:hypothetical protein
MLFNGLGTLDLDLDPAAMPTIAPAGVQPPAVALQLELELDRGWLALRSTSMIVHRRSVAALAAGLAPGWADGVSPGPRGPVHQRRPGRTGPGGHNGDQECVVACVPIPQREK